LIAIVFLPNIPLMKREKQKPLMSREEQEQAERFRSHQERFEERRRSAGFCRWMAGRFRTAEEKRAIADRPLPPLVTLPKRSG
jgi:hypothetical protein